MSPDAEAVADSPAPTSEPISGRHEAIASEISAHLGDVALELTENYDNLILRVAPEDRPRALGVLKTLGFSFYSWAAGVDWPEKDKLEVLDHVENIERRVMVTVKCEVPRSNPRVPTVTTIYHGADWHERETWELFGIVFVGHPRLRRLLLADWQEGYPMRKDEVLRPRVEKPWPGDFFSG